MAKEEVLIGQTDYTVPVFIPDPASTDGSGKTGLVAANLTVSFTRFETDNDVVITDATGSLSDLSALTDAHADWGLKEVSNTLAPGLYRLDIADAVFASGAWSAVVYVMITTSAAAASPMEFTLVTHNPRADIAAILVDTGTTLDGKIDTIDTVVDTILVDTNELQTDWVNGGRLDLILDIIAADTTTDIPALIATLQTFVDTEITAIDDLLDTELPALTTAVADLPTNAELATALGTADDAVLAQIALVKAVTDQLAQSVKTIVEGTCDAGSTTTSIVASATTPASGVNDQFNGRIMIFTEDTTTVALRGQATDITDYVHATKTFTVTALTTGPASGDVFCIL